MKIDALMLQNKRQKNTFSSDIRLGRNVICGESEMKPRGKPQSGLLLLLLEEKLEQDRRTSFFKTSEVCITVFATNFNSRKT